MRIVCGTDFSEAAQRACQAAGKLAKRLGDTLVLVHVVDITPYQSLPELTTYLPQLDEALFRAAREQLRRAAESLRGEGVAVEETLLPGWADQGLLRAAGDDVRLFVVGGTAGERAMSRLGHVAERVARTAPQPTLVVQRETEGLVEWLSGTRPLRVLLPIDRTRASDAAVGWVAELRKVVPVDVTLVHYYSPLDERSRLGLVGAMSPFETHPLVVSALERELGRYVDRLTGDGRVELRILPHWGRLQEPVDEEAHVAKADIIVVGTHQRGLVDRAVHGSVAQSVLHGSRIPVLAVPAKLAQPDRTRPTIGHVLVTTDFSDLANEAIRYAHALLPAGGIVDLCHVTERALEPEARAQLEARLWSLVPPEEERPGVVTRVDVVHGADTAEAIAQLTERVGADVICLASHGRGGLTHLVLGSVAQALLEQARRPVFIVPRPRG